MLDCQELAVEGRGPFRLPGVERIAQLAVEVACPDQFRFAVGGGVVFAPVSFIDEERGQRHRTNALSGARPHI
jgi:hypothetical protein